MRTLTWRLVGAFGLLLSGCGAPPGAPSPERVAAESAAMARIAPLVREHGADVAWSARLAGPTTWRTETVSREELASEWVEGRAVGMAGSLLALQDRPDGNTRMVVRHTQLSDGARLFGTAVYIEVDCRAEKVAALRTLAEDAQRVSGLAVDAFVIARIRAVSAEPPVEHRGPLPALVGRGDCLAATDGRNLPQGGSRRFRRPENLPGPVARRGVTC